MSNLDATGDNHYSGLNDPDRDSTDQAPRAGSPTVMTNYSPELYAFRFPNAFVNHVWSGRIPPFIGRRYSISTAGRCGGMAFASLDFYHHGTPVPTLAPEDFSSGIVPPDGHPLADYIYTRQLHSMLTSVGGVRDGLRYLRWSGESTASLLARTAAEEPKIVQSLDRGQPVVLGLIKATSRSIKAQGANHQVVCYGYNVDNAGHLEFYIYDPNEPYRVGSSDHQPVVLGRVDDFEQAQFPFHALRHGRIDRWRGFFVVGYRPRKPDRAVPTT